MAKSRKTNKRRTRHVMRGGYTPDEENQLRGLGVSDDMISQFASENLAFNDIVQAVHEMQQEDQAIAQEGVTQAQMQVQDDDAISTHSSLHLSDLGDANSLASGETTHDRNIFSDDDISSDEEDEFLHGGKKRRTMKRRKAQKRRTTRKQRGGDVFYSDKQRKHLIELGILQKNLKKWQEAKFPYEKAVNYLNDDHADNYTDKQKRQLERKGWSSEHIEKYNGNIPFELLVNENPKGRKPAKNSNSSTDIEEERFSDVPFNSDRTSTGRSSRKTTRKQRGGVCYGNGVGANSNDPNFSIYNTRELELFPYKPA